MITTATTMFDWNKAYYQSGDPKLRPTYATMAVLASYADFSTRTCYPSQRTLADKLGYVKTETIRLHILTNIKAGWLRQVPGGNPRTGTNMYEFLIPTPPVKRGSCQRDSHRQKGESDELPPWIGDSSPLVKGETPPADRALTTKRTNQGTTHQSGSNGEPPDPWGSGVISPATRSTNQDTPPGEGGSSPPARREIPDWADPFDPEQAHYFSDN